MEDKEGSEKTILAGRAKKKKKKMESEVERVKVSSLEQSDVTQLPHLFLSLPHLLLTKDVWAQERGRREGEVRGKGLSKNSSVLFLITRKILKYFPPFKFVFNVSFVYFPNDKHCAITVILSSENVAIVVISLTFLL